MLKNYFITALRNLRKDRLNSLISVSGLVLGMTTCLLLGAYVIHEYNFDRFHTQGKNIYRLNTDLVGPDQRLELSLASGLAGPSLKKDFPEVRDFIRISRPQRDLTFHLGNQAYFERNVLYADSSFFTSFDFNLLAGDPVACLREPGTMVITQSLAHKYFGDQASLGKTIGIDDKPYQVTGIVQDPPYDSHIRFDAVLSYAGWVKEFPYTEQNWTWTPATTYLVLKSGVDYHVLEKRIERWIKNLVPPEPDGSRMDLSLEPFLDIHFGKTRLGDLSPSGNRVQVILLMITGIFVLFIALFNYINLSTLSYSGRGKEIAVRKTFGAARKQLAFQFLLESILLCLFSLMISLLAARLLIPAFNQLAGLSLSLVYFNPLWLTGCFLIAVFIVGPLAGFYPSFVISGIGASSIFQGKAEMVNGKISIRKLLTVVQFLISIILISCTLVIRKQQQFLVSHDPGFSKNNKMIIRMGDRNALAASPEIIKEKIRELPGVKYVSLSSHVPGEHAHGLATTIRKGDGKEVNSELELNLVDPDFIQTYGLQMVAGRAFSGMFAGDSTGDMILNETAVQKLGFKKPDDVLGLDCTQWGRNGKVIGVVKDFNQHTLQSSIEALSFQFMPSGFEKITIDFETTDLPSFVSLINKTWKQSAGDVPFDYSFLDNLLVRQYEKEKLFSRIFLAFSILAISIACLGLYGLSGSMIRKKRREIGIRKVLGASIPGIMLNLSYEIIGLVSVSLMLATPVAWYLMHNWLQDYSYRIHLNLWIFSLAGLAAFFIAGLTVGALAFKAALASPAKALRSE